MKYLTLSADYQSVALSDDCGQAVDLRSLGLSEELLTALERWAERYQRVIPWSIAERRVADKAEAIRGLDSEGEALAKQIEKEISGRSKIRYYSEGVLALIDK